MPAIQRGRVSLLNSSCSKLMVPCMSSVWRGDWMWEWAGPREPLRDLLAFWRSRPALALPMQ